MDVIFDLDGTLCDVSDRVQFVTPPTDWDERALGRWTADWKSFFAGIKDDAPIEPVCATLRALHAAGHRILLCSGREQKFDAVSRDWLDRHNVPFHAIYLRANGDNRSDHVVKLELLADMRADGHDPKLVFDDRASVVNMWRDAGLICAQVAPGNF